MQSLKSGPPPLPVFELFVRRWRMLKLRAQHVRLFCIHLLQSSTSRVCRLISKFFSAVLGVGPPGFCTRVVATHLRS